ncbi:MAG: hypothetical protein GY895_08990, partial [Phycisphaera sp.]|nr:hypothetical protein [Phycisphaera sp.]
MISTFLPTRFDRTAAGPAAGVASRLGMGLLLLVFSASSASHAVAQDDGGGEFTEDLPEELVGVDIVEHLDETLPLDLVFTDDDGEQIKLRDIIDGERPTILQIGYFKCPMLCKLVLYEAMDGMSGVEDLSAGTDFDLV